MRALVTRTVPALDDASDRATNPSKTAPSKAGARSSTNGKDAMAARPLR